MRQHASFAYHKGPFVREGYFQWVFRNSCGLVTADVVIAACIAGGPQAIGNLPWTRSEAEAEQATHERKLAERKRPKRAGRKLPGRRPNLPSDDQTQTPTDHINLADADVTGEWSLVTQAYNMKRLCRPMPG